MRFKETIGFLTLAVTSYKLNKNTSHFPKSLQTVCLPEMAAILISCDLVIGIGI